MQSLETQFPAGDRRGDEAHERLARAYRNFFSTEDGQIVLADIVDYAGYYTVCDYSVGALGLADHNARRAVIGRIIHFLRLTPDEFAELERAARQAKVTSNREGNI